MEYQNLSRLLQTYLVMEFLLNQSLLVQDQRREEQ